MAEAASATRRSIQAPDGCGRVSHSEGNEAARRKGAQRAAGDRSPFARATDQGRRRVVAPSPTRPTATSSSDIGSGTAPGSPTGAKMSRNSQAITS